MPYIYSFKVHLIRLTSICLILQTNVTKATTMTGAIVERHLVVECPEEQNARNNFNEGISQLTSNSPFDKKGNPKWNIFSVLDLLKDRASNNFMRVKTTVNQPLPQNNSEGHVTKRSLTEVVSRVDNGPTKELRQLEIPLQRNESPHTVEARGSNRSEFNVTAIETSHDHRRGQLEPDTETGHEHTRRQLEPETGHEHTRRQLEPETGHEHRRQQFEPETGHEHSRRQLEPETGHEHRRQQLEPETGHEHRRQQFEPETGHEHRRQQFEPETGHEHRRQQFEPETGHEHSRRQLEPETGHEHRRQQLEPETGHEHRKQQFEPETGYEHRRQQLKPETGHELRRHQLGSKTETCHEHRRRQLEPETGHELKRLELETEIGHELKRIKLELEIGHELKRLQLEPETKSGQEHRRRQIVPETKTGHDLRRRQFVAFDTSASEEKSYFIPRIRPKRYFRRSIEAFSRDEALPWACQAESYWVDLGPHVLPRFVPDIRCVGDMCWYGHYYCKSITMQMPVLVVHSGTCADSRLPEDIRSRYMLSYVSINTGCVCGRDD